MKRTRKATPRRPEQVAEQIRQILAEMLVHGEIRDPRVTSATVTAVKVGKDLSTARVWVALAGSKEEQAAALEGLKSAAGFIRTRVARELTTYTAPEFRFQQDLGAEHGARIDAILADLRGGSGVTPDLEEHQEPVDGPDGAGDGD